MQALAASIQDLQGKWPQVEELLQQLSGNKGGAAESKPGTSGQPNQEWARTAAERASAAEAALRDAAVQAATLGGAAAGSHLAGDTTSFDACGGPPGRGGSWATQRLAWQQRALPRPLAAMHVLRRHAIRIAQ